MSFKLTKVTSSSRGFTLIELLVTIGIMVVLVGLVVANFAGTSPQRNLKVVHNELVSNIREMQSFATDNRDLPSGTPASAYQLTFDIRTPAAAVKYNLAGYDNAVIPNMVALSTQRLLAGIVVSSISITHAGGAPVSATQLRLMYTLPYGRMFASYSGGSTGATDEVDDNVTINLANTSGTVTSSVIANGVTGGVQ